MKIIFISGILFLFSALVDVGSQTLPYISFRGISLSNHSYINAILVGSYPNGVQCHTDLSTCCSAHQGDDRGDWHAPGSQDRLPFHQNQSVYERREAQQVVMYHRQNSDVFGIYHCTIETNAVNDDDGREIVYVGLYASGGESLPNTRY